MSRLLAALAIVRFASTKQPQNNGDDSTQDAHHHIQLAQCSSFPSKKARSGENNRLRASKHFHRVAAFDRESHLIASKQTGRLDLPVKLRERTPWCHAHPHDEVLVLQRGHLIAEEVVPFRFCGCQWPIDKFLLLVPLVDNSFFGPIVRCERVAKAFILDAVACNELVVEPALSHQPARVQLQFPGREVRGRRRRGVALKTWLDCRGRKHPLASVQGLTVRECAVKAALVSQLFFVP